MIRKIPIEFIIGLLVLLFVYTGMSKLIDFEAFKWQMSNQPLPKGITNLLTLAVPLSEIGISLMLLIKPLRLYGL